MGLDPEVVAMAALLQDTARTLPVHPIDSIVDKTLLPDPVTPVIQFIFQQPPWVMWGGVVLAAIVAFYALRWLWPRRQAILGWFATRGRGVKLAMLGGAGAAVLVASGLGFAGYHFVETDRRFCNGCHIFVPSGQAMVQADTGYYSIVPQLEGKHDSISCHTCHPLKPLKEGVKLVFWMSGVRGKEIPEHAKVPRKTCEGCHVLGAAKETWQAIAATAGHRTHLESDSLALKGKVECLTCHARTAHRFLPADSTCVQRGCHLTDDIKIRLGRMAGQTEMHCTVCHQFTKPVALLATRDSAAGALRPDFRQCLSCHQMKERLPGFASGPDPHSGTCGMCHDPHAQARPKDALKSCTDAQCHSSWRDVKFHTGAAHRKVQLQCITCHDPHSARVDASDCQGCHERARAAGTGVHPPEPFDTLKALERTLGPPAREPRGKGDAPPEASPAAQFLPGAPADSFSHEQHKRLACLTCHSTTSKQSSLTFEPPRGCQICHHQAPEQAQCVNCHSPAELTPPREVAVTVRVPKSQPRARNLTFRHDTHEKLRCTECHSQPVTLEPADEVSSCRSCHDAHHEAGRNCATCHRTSEIYPAHQAVPRTHEGCAACHTEGTILPLTVSRGFCLACHAQAQDHYGPRECTVCHFIQSPDEFRPQLTRARPGG